MKGRGPDAKKKTFGVNPVLEAITSHIYTDDEIKHFDMHLALESHPLAHKPVNMRSRLAYKELTDHIKPNPRYLLPGMFAVFGYRHPKYEEQLPYYDATPAVIFCGITRTNDDTIRELGFNLHYFPPFTRARIIEVVYSTFRKYYDKHFNDAPRSPYSFIDYNKLKRMLDRYGIGFGLRMYIPVLRSQTYVVPTRLISTMMYTEGHFSGATLAQIQRFWRRFRGGRR